MADIPGPHVKFTGDADGLKKAAAEGDKAVEQFAKRTEAEVKKATKASERSLDGFNKRIHLLGSELKGTPATAKLHEIALAVERIGGPANISAGRLEKLRGQVNALVSDGGKLPPALNSIAASSNKMGSALQTGAVQGLSSMSARLGPAAAGLTALGPAGLAAAASVAVTGGAALAVGNGLLSASEAAVKFGDTIMDAHRLTGISIESLQRLKFAAEALDVPFESVLAAVTKMQTNMVKSPEVFDALGLSVEKLRAMKPEEQLAAIAGALNSLNDIQLQNAASEAIFGRSYEEVVPFLRDNFGELAAKAHEFGAVKTDDQVKKLAAVDDELNKLKSTWGNLVVSLGTALAGEKDPTKAIEKITQAVAAMSRFIQENAPMIRTQLLTAFSPVLGIASGLAAGFGKANEWAASWGLVNQPRPEKKAGFVGPPRPGGPDAAALEAALNSEKAAAAKKAMEALAKAQAEARKEAEEYEKTQQRLREEIERFNPTVEVLNREMSVFAFKVERAGGATALTDETLRQSVKTLQDYADAGGKNAYALETLAQLQEERIQRELKEGKLVRLANGDLIKTTALTDEQRHAVEELRKAKDAEGEKAVEAEREKQRALQRTMEIYAGLQGILGDLVNVLEVSGLGSEKLKGALEGLGGALGGLANMASGDPFKMISGGLQILASSVPIVEALDDAFHESTAEKVAKDIGSRLGVQISEGLAEEISQHVAKKGAKIFSDALGEIQMKMGRSGPLGQFEASLLHIDDIIKEAGGAEMFGADKATEQMQLLVQEVGKGTILLREANEIFDETFGDVAAASIDKTTGIASDGLREMVRQAKEFGIESQALSDFMSGEATKGLEGLASGLAAGGAGLTSQGAATAMGASIAAFVAELEAAGMSTKDALEAAAPAIQALREQLQQTGFDGGAAFASLDAQLALMTDEVTGPLIEGVSGLATAMVSLGNLGQLDQATFAGLAEQISANYNELVALGTAGPAALQAMAPDLQKVWEMQQRYGFAVDESTQKLLTEAEAAGLVGEAHMSAEDRMVEGIDRMATAMEAFAEAMGVKLPEAAKAAADGMNAAFDGVKLPELDGPGPSRDGERDGGFWERLGIPRKAIGFSTLTSSGPIWGHKGEALVPAAMNPASGRATMTQTSAAAALASAASGAPRRSFAGASVAPVPSPTRAFTAPRMDSGVKAMADTASALMRQQGSLQQGLSGVSDRITGAIGGSNALLEAIFREFGDLPREIARVLRDRS